MRLLITGTVALLAFCSVLSAADPSPSTAFQSWSSFAQLNVQELSAGKIVTSANASMSMARGLSAQAAYVVSGPVDRAMQVLLAFDPTKHKGLDGIQHHLFKNETEAGFEKLTLDPGNSAVKALLKAVQDRSGLQLSKDETARLPGAAGAPAVRDFLSANLRQRWKLAAEKGELGGSGSADTRAEIRALLAGEPGIAGHFARLLAPVTAKSGPVAPKFHYWDLGIVNKTAAIDLGMLFTLDVGERRQVLDLTYYTSSGYLTAATLWELVPITIGGRAQTLVWQCSLVSSNELTGGFGIKRKIAARIIVSDLEKWIRIFQREVAGGTR